MSELGGCLIKVKEPKIDEAERLLQAGYSESQNHIEQFPEYLRFEITGYHLRRLVEFYNGTARPAEAAKYQQRLTEMENAEGQTLSEKDFVQDALN